MYTIDPREMAWTVVTFDAGGEHTGTEFFCRQEEAEAFAEDCAAEGEDCFVSHLVRTIRAEPEPVNDPLDPYGYGVRPGADYPATLCPPFRHVA